MNRTCGGAVVLFTDLFQRGGRIECLLGKEQSLYLVDGEEHQELISGIPGQITALAAGDLTGGIYAKTSLLVLPGGRWTIFLFAAQRRMETGSGTDLFVGFDTLLRNMRSKW